MEEDGLNSPELAEPAQKLILIVDDEPGQLELFKHIAQREGFRTESATNGLEGLSKAEALSPDLILLDLLLPGTSGYEVLRGLQAAGNGGIPVIVMTARTMDRKTVEMVRQESNVKEFVQKPVSPDILAVAIHKLLKTRPATGKRPPLKP